MGNDFLVYIITTGISSIPLILLYVHFMKRLKEIKRANGFDTMDHFVKTKS